MRIRPPTREDAGAVLALVTARDIADYGRPDYSLEDLLEDWGRPDCDLERDCFLAEDDGRAVGYAGIDDRAAMVLVHPGAEGRGIGTALREAVERRAAERGQPPRQFLPASNPRAIEHVTAAGYEREHVYLRMRGPLDDAPAPDPSIAVRRLDLEREGRPAHALVEEAFAEIAGNVPEPYEVFAAHVRRSQPEFRLAVDDDEGLAALATGQRWEGGVGYVAIIAVDRRARGRGYGRALLLAMLRAFREAGLDTAELSVHGANVPATGLYESAGLREAFRQERWIRRG